MNKLSPHIARQKGSKHYYYRRRVPCDIRGILGKPLVYQTLGTHRLSEALWLADMYTGYLDALFERARRMSTPDPEDILRRIAAGQPVSAFHIREKLADGSEVDVEVSPTDIQSMKDAGMTGDQISDFLLSAARRGRVEAAMRVVESRQGQALSPDSVESNIPAIPSPSTKAPESKPSINLSTLGQKWLQDRADRVAGDWEPDAKEHTKIRRLVEILGDVPPSAVEPADAERVRTDLSRMPSNTRRYRGCTVPEILAACEKSSGYPQFSSKSVSDHLESYRSLWRYAIRHGYSRVNPFEGVFYAENQSSRSRKKRKGFSSPELAAIFRHPIFTDPSRYHCRHQRKKGGCSGNRVCIDYMYWGPLIALLTGARRNEIASLYLEDIYTVGNVYVFDFNENHADKSLKTDASTRKVPVHPDLLRLGLLKYVERQRNRGCRRLFEGSLDKWSKKEHYGQHLGQDVIELIRLQLAVPEGEKGMQVFHCFRHTFSSSAHNKAHIGGRDIDFLGGWKPGEPGSHSSGGTRQITYTHAEVQHLFNQVKKLDFSSELAGVRRWAPGYGCP